MRSFQTLSELAALVGQEVATSEWTTVTQAQINLFAQATGDHQWIHVDEERSREGPFGTTIAHGLLTLSLMPQFFAQAIEVREVGMGINYGYNKVRFTGTVPVGSRLRARLKLLACEPIDRDGYQMTWEVITEREGVAKPVCVAEAINRRYP